MLEFTQNLRFFDLFNIFKTQNAFRSDSLESTKPMTNDEEKVKTVAEISGQFDNIAYDKCK
jgi:aminopeptidase N